MTNKPDITQRHLAAVHPRPSDEMERIEDNYARLRTMSRPALINYAKSIEEDAAKLYDSAHRVRAGAEVLRTQHADLEARHELMKGELRKTRRLAGALAVLFINALAVLAWRGC